MTKIQTSDIRTIAGFEVSFYVKRRDAIGEANRRTTESQVQHRSFKTAHGWVVVNVNGDMYDSVGELSDTVIDAL